MKSDLKVRALVVEVWGKKVKKIKTVIDMEGRYLM